MSNDEGNNQLHGGAVDFTYRFWHTEICNEVLKFTLKSSDDDQKFPVSLKMMAEYEIIENSLEIRYSVISDGDTV